MAFFWLMMCSLVLLITGNSEVIDSCDLVGGENLFYWYGQKYPHYYTQSGKDCELEPYVANSHYKDHKRRVILTIGDSLDMYPCKFFNDVQRKLETNIISPTKENRHVTVMNCTKEENIQLMNYFILGILTNSPSNFTFKAHGTTEKLKLIQKTLTELDMVPTHITFTSFLWDLYMSFHIYCLRQVEKNKESITDFKNINCLCDNTQRQNAVCTFASRENFERTLIPWCTEEYNSIWRDAYMQTIRLIHSLFPQAMIFVRTNPPSTRIDHGTSHCQSVRNQFIRNLVKQSEHNSNTLVGIPKLRLIDFDAFLRNEIYMKNDAHHYGFADRQWNDLLLHDILDAGFM